MPDHLHMLISIDGVTDLGNLVRDFKRITARTAKVHWQRNFFDHRLRTDESESEKTDYILQNPIRAGLIESGEDWAYIIDAEDLDPKCKAGD